MKILVVDDEEMILQLAERILTRAGHEVLLSESGRQSLEMYAQASNEIDLVLLDLGLKDMSGIQVLEQMRAVNPNLPCVLSSGNCPPIDKIPEEIRSGTLILEKPYHASALVEIIEQAAAGAASPGQKSTT